MTIITIALIIICFLFAITSFAVCRKLTPVVNDKRTVHYIDCDETTADDLYNCYRRFQTFKKSTNVEQGDIIRYVPLDSDRVMITHSIEKRHFQVVDVFDGEKIGAIGYVICSIMPCYYSCKD